MAHDRSRGPRGALVATSAAPWGLAVAALTSLIGCGATPDSASAGEGALGSAEQALACITLQRIGAAPGGVEDAVIARDPADPTKATSNYGSVSQMSAGHVATETRRVLLQFDLSGVPAGSTVTTATLSFRVIQSLGKADVPIHLVTAPWSEATVTWNELAAAPGDWYSPDAFATLVTNGLPNNSTVSFDVTSQVEDWVSGAAPNDGLLFDHPDPGRTVIASSESPSLPLRPKLSLCFVAPN